MVRLGLRGRLAYRGKQKVDAGEGLLKRILTLTLRFAQSREGVSHGL